MFDDQLVRAGAELVRGRLRLVERLGPLVNDRVPRARAVGASRRRATTSPSGARVRSTSRARPRSRPGSATRSNGEPRPNVDRGITLVGPHRDELRLEIDGLDARTQASQGEQRTLALALRLAGHEVVTELTGATPVLLLDDVFSELDARRAPPRSCATCRPARRCSRRPACCPPGIAPERRLRVDGGP